MNFNKKLLGKTIGATLLTCASTVQAANWLMLQGTEPAGQSERANVWGFIQVQYQKDNSDPNATGGYIPPKLIGPNLTSQEQFNVNRARIGVRGTGLTLDSKVNYFILAEFGNNGITAPGGYSPAITDASVTLNHIPGARIRAGLFKYPGAEEGLQAIHVFDYVNFTTVTNQLLLERFPTRTYSDNNPPTKLPSETPLSGFDSSVGAFRDVGIQVFDTFKVSNWEHSYAVMYGNGNGLNTGNPDESFDTYLYWSSELVFGGKGGRREGLKMFVWNQSGKRLLDNTNDSIYNPNKFDRDRTGLGVKYLQKPFRVSAEYMDGSGMIFQGPDKPTFDVNATATANPAGGDGSKGDASGYYLEGGWYIPGTNWEIDLRYDVYNRLEGDKFEFEFVNTTLGAQYHINKKARINMEITDRSAEAINFASGAGPNANLDGVDNLYAVQLTHIF